MAYKLTSARCDYMTPLSLIDNILEIEGVNEFDVDVCCSEHNIPAKKHYSEKDNGLLKSWGKLNWCNPPFKFSRQWLNKALEEQKKGNSTWLILPFRPECVYWDNILCQKAEINNRIVENKYFHLEIWKKGFEFINPDTKKAAGLYKNPLALLKLKGIKDYKIQKNLFQ